MLVSARVTGQAPRLQQPQMVKAQPHRRRLVRAMEPVDRVELAALATAAWVQLQAMAVAHLATVLARAMAAALQEISAAVLSLMR